MTSQMKRAHEPQQLEQLLVSRQRQGDVEGMVALYEAGAVLDDGSGVLAEGPDAIRKVFLRFIEAGQKFGAGEQQRTIVCGDLALTSTRLPDGTVTAEIARRQSDGSWLWVIDRFSIAEVVL